MSPVPSRRPAAPRGFTILEVMMAAVVMVLGIATSLNTITFGMRTVDNARNTALAAQIMQSEMENIRLLNWTQVTALVGTNTVNISSVITPGTGTTLDTALNNIINRFSCTCTVALLKTDMYSITVTVSWNGVDGRPHSNSYVTRYGNGGLYDYYYTTA
ncbi:MAG: hypothetical protein ACHQ4G_02620 [Opitutales bacterium]